MNFCEPCLASGRLSPKFIDDYCSDFAIDIYYSFWKRKRNDSKVFNSNFLAVLKEYFFKQIILKIH